MLNLHHIYAFQKSKLLNYILAVFICAAVIFISHKLFVPDATYAGYNPVTIGDTVNLSNKNFLENVGGENQNSYDAAQIICDRLGGFVFTETGWTNTGIVAPNSTGVGAITIKGVTIASFAVIERPFTLSSGPVAQVTAQDANSNNIEIKKFNLKYTGDLNNGFHTVGTVTLYNNQVFNIDNWIYPKMK